MGVAGGERNRALCTPGVLYSIYQGFARLAAVQLGCTVVFNGRVYFSTAGVAVQEALHTRGHCNTVGLTSADHGGTFDRSSLRGVWCAFSHAAQIVFCFVALLWQSGFCRVVCTSTAIGRGCLYFVELFVLLQL